PACGVHRVYRGQVEIVFKLVSLLRHPPRNGHTDRRELARRARQPDARGPVDALAREPERLDRPNQRLLEVSHVLLHVAAVPLEIEYRVTDELARPMERRLPAAVRLDELDVRI